MVKNLFPREGSWDAVGINCSDCKSFRSPPKWPDEQKEVFCNHHQVSLKFELRSNGYMEGEWFCKYFASKKGLGKKLSVELDKVRGSLQDNVVYKFGRIGDDFDEVTIK
ncbi:MAG: hypothetical protein HQL22_11730 [Candidatus Omnitrophica bacterium]|nr:hypothetical protein [Candidatus Omnitrophota bacterium]